MQGQRHGDPSSSLPGEGGGVRAWLFSHVKRSLRRCDERRTELSGNVLNNRDDLVGGAGCYIISERVEEFSGQLRLVTNRQGCDRRGRRRPCDVMVR